MKSFNSFIKEIGSIKDIEDLELVADSFQSNVDKNAYTLSQIQIFNNMYWDKKDNLLTIILNSESNIGYLKLFAIIQSAPRFLKNDISKLKQYIYNIKHGFNGKVLI